MVADDEAGSGEGAGNGDFGAEGAEHAAGLALLPLGSA